MLTVYHVPGTRSVRPVWLCYELDLPVKVELIDFSPEYRASAEWRAISPAGKVPAMIDGDLTLMESGAMVDYLLERYGGGRLRPAPGTPESALHHQWCWFAEATLIRPLGLHRVLRTPAEQAANLIADAANKFREAAAVVEAALAGRDYLLGDTFDGCDVMMGYSIALAERLLDDRYPNLTAYLARLQARPAYQQVLALKAPR